MFIHLLLVLQEDTLLFLFIALHLGHLRFLISVILLIALITNHFLIICLRLRLTLHLFCYLASYSLGWLIVVRHYGQEILRVRNLVSIGLHCLPRCSYLSLHELGCKLHTVELTSTICVKVR